MVLENSHLTITHACALGMMQHVHVRTTNLRLQHYVLGTLVPWQNKRGNCVVTGVAGWYKMFTQLQVSQVGRLLYCEYLPSQQYREWRNCWYIAQWRGGQSICYCKLVHAGIKLRIKCSFVCSGQTCADEGWNTVQYSFVMQLVQMGGT